MVWQNDPYGTQGGVFDAGIGSWAAQGYIPPVLKRRGKRPDFGNF
jgi:hypothetical protein